jgi:hypothetical protein
MAVTTTEFRASSAPDADPKTSRTSSTPRAMAARPMSAVPALAANCRDLRNPVRRV